MAVNKLINKIVFSIKLTQKKLLRVNCCLLRKHFFSIRDIWQNLSNLLELSVAKIMSGGQHTFHPKENNDKASINSCFSSVLLILGS